MYKESEKQTGNETELSISFGKNGQGLSDELITIGNKIKELSEKNHVTLRSSFIDEMDDVYELTFAYSPI